MGDLTGESTPDGNIVGAWTNNDDLIDFLVGLW